MRFSDFITTQMQKKHLTHRKNDLRYGSGVVFYAKMEYDIGLSQNRVPGVEN